MSTARRTTAAAAAHVAATHAAGHVRPSVSLAVLWRFCTTIYASYPKPTTQQGRSRVQLKAPSALGSAQPLSAF